MSSIKFKNTGKRLKDFNDKKNKRLKISLDKKKPIGIVLPLQDKSRSNESLFSMTYDLKSQVKVNLKNLLLTQKGEALCNPNFGTSLINIYNNTNLESIEDIAMSEIENAVVNYMPFVTLTNFSSIKVEETEEVSGYYELEIDYRVSGFNDDSKLVLNIKTSR
jgi:phage baseplate assembly protein W